MLCCSADRLASRIYIRRVSSPPGNGLPVYVCLILREPFLGSPARVAAYLGNNLQLDRRALQITASQKGFLLGGLNLGVVDSADQQLTGAAKHTLSCGVCAQLHIAVYTCECRVHAGGLGPLGPYTLALLGSEDVQQHIVSFYPPDRRQLDYGHLDPLNASNAKNVVWSKILAWLRNHDDDNSCSGD